MMGKKAQRQFLQARIREALRARPGCAIVSTIGCDSETGHIYLSFLCLNHDSTWRDFIDAPTDTGPYADKGCPRSSFVGSPPGEEGVAAPQAPEPPIVTNSDKKVRIRR